MQNIVKNLLRLSAVTKKSKRFTLTTLSRSRSFSSEAYVQGQSPKPGIREYFYYIDHQGMLFLDDSRMKNFTSCFKEQKFLVFFFGQLKVNGTDRYFPSFPYISMCGRERNYVRCDDLPIVFTHLLRLNEQYCLTYNYGGEKLVVPFQPEKLYMGSSGRIYHPGPTRLHGTGLVRSQLGLEFSQNFIFENGEDHPPTHFCFSHTTHQLDYSLKDALARLGREE